MTKLSEPQAKKIAIVGFTNSRKLTPFDDPSWEVWGLNNLHKYPDLGTFHRWFDLHPVADIRRDEAHAAWLKSTPLPVYVWEPQEDWPTSLAFPKQEVLSRAGRRYFTNSISWMIGLALLEGATEIGLYGIDMAQTGEYSAQRPSCEWIIGLAEGLGVKVTIPDTSDLLKSSVLYGAEDDSALRLKLEDRMRELQQRLAETEQQRDQAAAMTYHIQGAIEDLNYVLGVWTQPHVKRDDNDQE